MRHQRGSLSVGLLQYLSISLIILVFFTSSLLNVLSDMRLAKEVNVSVQEIRQKSALHYANQVLQSRCLPQTTLTMALIGIPDNDGLAKYDVKYIQRAQPNSAPSGIEIRATLHDKEMVERVARLLSPTQQVNDTFIFDFPLRNQLHDWQQLNVNNGCIK
uniref:Transporter n=1 Tax=Aliivibrio fischeri TaxID=668 RepID=H2ERX9_ALIFS|nr:hypothetical protein [Aliivibrio fischeri]AEY78146.1 transporter [Aliivibrio fischeri]